MTVLPGRLSAVRHVSISGASSASRLITASGSASAKAGTSLFAISTARMPGLLGPVHVVVGPVTDEHARGRVADPDGRHRGPERLRCGLVQSISLV